MAELYVKPGNQERGWNDPPQLSYGLQTAGGSKRAPLNKRVPAPIEGSPTVPPAASLPPSTPPVTLPPVGKTGLPPPGQVRIDSSQQRSSDADDEAPVDVEDILTPLNDTLAACKDSIKTQVLTEIGRRLAVLRDMWSSGKLSASVRRRMSLLVNELKNKNWDSADEIHRSLMVDHVNEVSQWMVGVKRLIAEARLLPQEDTPAEGTVDAAPQAS